MFIDNGTAGAEISDAKAFFTTATPAMRSWTAKEPTMPTAAHLLSQPVPVGTARRPRHPGRVRGAALVAGVLASTALATSPAAAFTPTATIFGANNITSSALAGAGSALPDVHVLGRGLSGPDALVVAGDDVFVEDGGSVDGVGGRVTELKHPQERWCG
jgi:hypothetical protein